MPEVDLKGKLALREAIMKGKQEDQEKIGLLIGRRKQEFQKTVEELVAKHPGKDDEALLQGKIMLYLQEMENDVELLQTELKKSTVFKQERDEFKEVYNLRKLK